MKAAVLYEPGRPLVIEDGIEIPALRRGQVLVQVFYSGVCHSQVMEARGHRGNDPYLPHMLGHEATGEVVETGPEVTKVGPGDRIVLSWVKGCGIEAGGSQYRKGDRIINAGGVTTFSDYAIVSENRCVSLPKDVPADIGVLFGCAVPTGAGIVINSLKPHAGATIAVVGLGGIGLCALAAASGFAPSCLIGIDIDEKKLNLARRLGATHTIHAGHTNAVNLVRQITGGSGADYSIEAAGSNKTIELAFEIVRRGGGRCIFASHPKAGSLIRLDPFELICGKRIDGSWGGSSKPDSDVPKFAELYRQKQLPLEVLITKRYTLDQINDALDDLEAGRVGRPLIEINPIS